VRHDHVGEGREKPVHVMDPPGENRVSSSWTFSLQIGARSCLEGTKRQLSAALISCVG
jgi:hypothetical protein